MSAPKLTEAQRESLDRCRGLVGSLATVMHMPAVQELLAIGAIKLTPISWMRIDLTDAGRAALKGGS